MMLALDKTQQHYAKTSTDTVVRYAVTHIHRNGGRMLTFPAQGRHTHETPWTAQQLIFDMERLGDEQGDAGRIESIYGAQAVGTFQVRAVACYPGHFDPKGIYFENDTEEPARAQEALALRTAHHKRMGGAD